ncbi:DinB family protein [Emticicia sp. CRIBPO]|uniref:DinB family protein n=1 Tax=Emticicia sp. CRIBPO TaxID=2683258 RepID=UPI001412D0B0|nr:DinB family protein [Emticicia sp. CRIBPO]NBA86665.1 DinB family protein [Emticicia sp. CRIBPO]
MTPIELIILNFEEIRRRSLILWGGISPEMYFWKPDMEAKHTLELVRHVLESDHIYHKIVENRGNIGDYESPWTDRPYTDLKDELEFAESYRLQFFEAIRSFSPEDLSTVVIDRSELGQRRFLGDYLQRIAYHEAVHTGQMLSYLRTFGLERPDIWD